MTARMPAGSILLVALVAACVDYEGSVDPLHGLPDVAVAQPSFVHDVQPIFVRRCALGGCHSLATRQAGLTLTRDSAWTALVLRPASLRSGEIRVRPGNSGNSWLVAMIGNDPARRHDYNRMPLGSGPLTANQIATIVAWIDRGASPQ